MLHSASLLRFSVVISVGWDGPSFSIWTVHKTCTYNIWITLASSSALSLCQRKTVVSVFHFLTTTSIYQMLVMKSLYLVRLFPRSLCLFLFIHFFCFMIIAQCSDYPLSFVWSVFVCVCAWKVVWLKSIILVFALHLANDGDNTYLFNFHLIQNPFPLRLVNIFTP